MEHKNMICFQCLKSFINIDILIHHIKHLHPFVPNFVCKQNNCYRSFPRLNGLKKHLINDHMKCEMVLQSDAREQIKRSNNLNFVEYENVIQNDSIDGTKCSSVETLDTSQLVYNAIIHFTSKMYSSSSLPRNIVTDVVNNTKELVEIIIVCIESALKKQTVMEDALNTVRVIYNEVNSIFKMLETEHMRLKVMKNSKYYIEPSPFFIGERSVIDRKNKSYEAKMVVQKSEGQIIELHEILKQFLELPNVFDDIISYMQEEESQCDKSVCRNILQADLWKEVKLKFLNKIVFPLYLFYDDFEPNNPLGSKSGIYKIGAVYISVASVPVQYVSLLENIFLTQLCFSADRVQYGNKSIFYKIIQQLKYLEIEGITIKTSSGKDVHIYFTLLLILGDNLGLNSILGFEESFRSNYFCRFCRTHTNETKHQIMENEENLRSIENYDNDSFSLSCGIKEICIWHELPNFHVTQNVYCDLMHDMLEGILRYDMAEIINYLI